MFNQKVVLVLKLLLRFAFLFGAAFVVRRYLVITVECIIHVWETYPKECLSVLYAVSLAVMDVFDGAIFGRSVIDTFFDKLKSVASAPTDTPPTSGGK